MGNNSKTFICLTQVCIFLAMKYENALIVGLLEDFSTVVCFLIDIFVFGLSLTIPSLLGCICVGSVVLFIGFGGLK